MVTQKQIRKILSQYDTRKITIAVLGGHSALDVCRGASLHGFTTLALCKRGREKTYATYFRKRDDQGCIDDVIILDEFSDITKKNVQEKLRIRNTIIVHNRYFWVYFDFKKIENEFFVPIYGTRGLVKLEERYVPKNQYYLLQKARIRTPKIFKTPKAIDSLVIVKVSEAKRSYERAFFICSSYDDYQKKSNDLLKQKRITRIALEKAVIEEYAIGAQVNFNFFYSPLTKRLELMGTDTRRQTNLDGILRLPATEQVEVLRYLQPKMIETGHYTVTIKESLLEKVFELGERFVGITQREYPPGIIGPFALQGAIVAEESKEDIVIFDVSMRIPGSPGTLYTPYSGYLYGQSLSYGERIAIEIKKAISDNSLPMLCT